MPKWINLLPPDGGTPDLMACEVNWPERKRQILPAHTQAVLEGMHRAVTSVTVPLVPRNMPA